MPTIETIQASGGDYTTIQAWYDAHRGDITGDPNAPYIGELAAESFSWAAFTGKNPSTTDSTHYFHLRAQAGAEFTGDFDGSYPIINTQSSTGIILFSQDDYTRFEHFVVGDVTSAHTTASGIVIYQANNVLIDGCGAWNIFTPGNAASIIIYGIHIQNGANDTVTVRNCSVGYLNAENLKFGGSCWCAGVLIDNGTSYIYNNAVENLSSSATDTSSTVTGIGALGVLTTVANNVVGTVSASRPDAYLISASSSIVKNNASSTTAPGDDPQNGIVPANEFEDINVATMDLHMLVGGQCEDNGLNLIEESYTNAPTQDCDNEDRPITGVWSIGIDYHVILDVVGAWERPYVELTIARAWR